MKTPAWFRTLFRYFRTPALAGVFVVTSMVLAGWAGLAAPSASALTITPRLELNGDRGTTVRTTVKIVNEEKQSRTYFLSAQNFNSADETGNPSFNSRHEDLAVWVKTPASITLGPGENKEVPVEVNIPADAEPGGHFAAIFFLNEPPKSDEQAVELGVASKLGTLILLRVNGDFLQDATILEFGTTGKKHVFNQLPIQFYYRFQNVGDDHLKPLGDIQIKNMFGRTVKMLSANTVDGSVLPKSIRRFYSVWTEATGGLKQEPVVDLPKEESQTFWQTVNFQWHHFAFGRYTARLKLAFGTKELKSDHAEYVFYLVPWQLLSVAVPAGIILLILFWIFLKRYNRYIIRRAQANGQGRRK